MAFIGNQPTAVPLTSSQLADGLITTDKLAASAVTSAKILDSTIVNADIASTTINLTQKVTGTLPIANGGTALTTLGTAGQALVVNSTATALEFATVGATAGQVIQVVTATDSTQRTTTSSSYVTASNTLSVAITPSAAANKILVLVNAAVGGPDGNSVSFSVFRGATNLGNGDNGFLLLPRTDDQGDDVSGFPVAYLDSPNTTSSTTYEVRFRASGSITAVLNYNGSRGNITLMEIKG